MDDIAQIYLNFIKEKHPNLAILTESMLEHGFTLQECIDLTQYQVNYRSIFHDIPKNSETLKFILWLLPKLDTDIIVEGICKRADVNTTADIWRPILESRQQNFHEK